MLKFQTGRVESVTMGGARVWLHCPDCLSVVNDKTKVYIQGLAYCVRCAAERYEERGAANGAR
jgi:hypothetical protein